MKVVSRLSSSFKAFITSVATMALVACGGGGGGTGGGFLPDNGGGTPTPSYTLTVSGADPNGAATNEFSASNPLTISVLVEDTSTNTSSTVSGAVVDLTSTVGTITPANASSLTNSNGIAQFGLEFSGDDGAGTVTATYTSGGTSYTAEFNVQSNVEQEPARAVISLRLDATNSTGTVLTSLSQRSPASIKATLVSTLDGVITPLEGELVTLSTNLGSVAPANATSLTNADGIAEFTVSYNGTEGAGTVSASVSVGGVTYDASLNLQSEDTGPPYQIELSLADADGNPLSTMSASQSLVVNARVQKIDGGQLLSVGQGEVVSFQSTLGALAGNSKALTNSEGVASISLEFDGGIGAGVVTASFESPDGGVVNASASVQSVTTAVGYTLAIKTLAPSGSPSRTFSAAEILVVEVVLSSTGGAVASRSLSLQSTVGTVSPANGSTLTNADGIARFEVAYNGIVGAGLVTASFGTSGGVITSSVEVESLATNSDVGLDISTLAADGSATTEFTVDEPMTVQVQLTNSGGDPLAKGGEIINLTTSIGGLDANSKLTDESGVASFQLSSTGLIGAGVVEASYDAGDDVVRVQKAVQAVSLNPYTLSLTTSSRVLTEGSDITITVSLLDPEGDPAAGEIIGLNSDIGTLDRLSAVTNSSGQATFTLASSGVFGAGTITATFDRNGEVFSQSVVLESVSIDPPYEMLPLVIKDSNGVILDATTSPITFSTRSSLTIEVPLVSRDDNTVALPNRIIALNSDLGSVSPENGVSLTNADGKAIFTLSNPTSTGAGTVTATYTAAQGIATQTQNILAVYPELKLGYFDNGIFQEGILRVNPSNGLVGYLGSASIFVNVVDSDTSLIDDNAVVEFSSNCLVNGYATLSSANPVTVSAGAVNVTYTAGPDCEGNDTITATLIQGGLETDVQASETLSISGSGTPYITFENATPVTIALEGTGGGSTLSEQSQVSFIVSDADGSPIAEELVSFALSTYVGGLRLTNTTAQSDANGRVVATVDSGRVATPVRVIAELDSTGSSVVSDILTVTSGIPDQNSVSLSAGTLAIAGALNIDGVTTDVTVRLADRFNNVVPDGTAATFSTEYGAIVGGCTTTGGSCSVTWTSQAPRDLVLSPGNLVRIDRESCPDYTTTDANVLDPCPSDLGYPRGGRSTILVTALGEESFTDENGDGEWDDGEAFQDLTEAFLDDNEDGVYTPRDNSECLKLGVGPDYDACLLAGDEEEFVDYNSNGSFDTANGVFDGLSCDLAAGAFCSSSLLNVRDSLVLILSPSDDIYTAVVDLGTGAHLPDGSGVAAGGSYVAYFSDIYNNRPAAGATITISASGDCTILTQASFTVPDSNRLGAYAVGFNVGSDGVVDPGDDTVSVSVANPGGVTNTQTFACTP